MAGISRSAFYKYKDAIYLYDERMSENITTLYLTLEDRPGVLSLLLSELYRAGANIITVNQNIPVDLSLIHILFDYSRDIIALKIDLLWNCSRRPVIIIQGRQGERSMKIGVVGLDAAGCIIAGHLLAKTAHDICTYDPDGRRCGTIVRCDTAAELFDPVSYTHLICLSRRRPTCCLLIPRMAIML